MTNIMIPLNGTPWKYWKGRQYYSLNKSFNLHVVEKLLVKEDPGLYSFINQGCLTVDNMDDKEEMRLTDVCGKTTIQIELCP